MNDFTAQQYDTKMKNDSFDKVKWESYTQTSFFIPPSFFFFFWSRQDFSPFTSYLQKSEYSPKNRNSFKSQRHDKCYQFAELI